MATHRNPARPGQQKTSAGSGRRADRKSTPPIAEASPRSTGILAASFAGLLLVRFLLEYRSGAWGWGVDFARYLPPAWRWGPWIVALALVIVAALPRLGEALARGLRPLAARPTAGLWLAALACGAACFWLCDLTYFTGDSALRRSAIVGITDFDRLFPQASALDRFLHLVLPRTLVSWTDLPVGPVASGQGALTAALFAAIAITFARRYGAGRAGSLAAGAVMVGSAALGLFAGYDKSLAELSLVTLAFGVAGYGEVSRGRPGWTSGILMVLAIALHRSGLALVPAWTLLWIWVPDRARADHRRRLPWARLVPAALAVVQLPLIWKVSRAVDARHLAPTGMDHVLTSAADPGRVIALANLAVFLAPLLPLFPVALALARTRERSWTWLGWLAVSWVLPMLAIHPVQGEFRDWDDFAPAAVAMSLPLAVLLGRAAGTSVVLAMAVMAAALVPRVQFLALQASPKYALERIESWAMGPPIPARTVAASTLEFVAVSHYRAKRIDAGRRAMAAAIANVPWERLYLGWANAEDRAGNWTRAVELYEETGARFPLDPTTWMMFAQAALLHGDRASATRAVANLRRVAPGDPWTARAEAALRAMPAPPSTR